MVAWDPDRCRRCCPSLAAHEIRRYDVGHARGSLSGRRSGGAGPTSGGAHATAGHGRRPGIDGQRGRVVGIRTRHRNPEGGNRHQ